MPAPGLQRHCTLPFEHALKAALQGPDALDTELRFAAISSTLSPCSTNLRTAPCSSPSLLPRRRVLISSRISSVRASYVGFRKGHSLRLHQTAFQIPVSGTLAVTYGERWLPGSCIAVVLASSSDRTAAATPLVGHRCVAEGRRTSLWEVQQSSEHPALMASLFLAYGVFAAGEHMYGPTELNYPVGPHLVALRSGLLDSETFLLVA